VGACPESQRWTESPAEVLRCLREQTRRWREHKRLRPCLSSGSAALDAWLGGGWPLGKVAELVGPHSAGRTTAAVSTAAAATARGEVVVWVDAADALDPPSLAAAGVDLGRVLWVRPATIEQAVRAAELVLEAGGLTVVVVDLAAVRPVRCETGGERRRGRDRWLAGGEPRPHPPTLHLASDHRSPLPGHRAGGRAALALRLVRAVERARAVALVLAAWPWLGGLAGVTVHLQRGGARWPGGERSGPRWFAGVALAPGGLAGGWAGDSRQEEDAERWRVVGGGEFGHPSDCRAPIPRLPVGR